MNHDDPRITSYALGELSDEERTALERTMAADPEILAEVSATRHCADLVRDALLHEKAERQFTLGPARRAALLSQPAPRKVSSFPAFIPLAGTALAACFVIALWLGTRDQGTGDSSGGSAVAGAAPAFESPAFTITILQVVSPEESAPAAIAPGDTTPALPDLAAVDQPAPRPIEIDLGPAVPEIGPDRTGTNPLLAEAPTFESGNGLAGPSGFIAVVERPQSSFPLAVPDTSYAQLEKSLREGALPSREDIRVEELINHFSYEVPVRESGEEFATAVEVATCPWSPDHLLARVTAQARPRGNRAPGEVAAAAAIEVAFDPRQVASYRLLGFTGGPAGTDSSSKTIPIGRIEPGQMVTALYEIVPADESTPAPNPQAVFASPPTRGAANSSPSAIETPNPQYPLVGADVRYQPPGGTSPVLRSAGGNSPADPPTAWPSASEDLRFAAAVAAFGLHLRGGTESTGLGLEEIADLAASATGPDPEGERAAFVELVRKAQGL